MFTLGIKLQNIAYGGQVFPAILTRHFHVLYCGTMGQPQGHPRVLVPMLCFGIGFLWHWSSSDLCYNIGTLLTTVILALYNTLGWLAVALLAAVLPFMISMWHAQGLWSPLRSCFYFDPGFEMLYMPVSLAHNISEGGACPALL